MITKRIVFAPDVRSFGAVRRREITLSSGHILAFNDVFDFDEEPFISVDIYGPNGMPSGYLCVLDGEYLHSIEHHSNQVIVKGNKGNEKKVIYDESTDSINIREP